MALTPNDVLNKQFQTTKFRDGYDQDEVDDFLDEVLAEFQRLIAENDQLKAQLGSAPAAAAAPAVDTAELTSLREQLAAAQGQVTVLGVQLAESQQALQTAQNAAAGAAAIDGMSSAEYLQLARRVHEEHVREGVVKRDELIAEGESKAATLIAEAQAESARLGAEARMQSEAVVGEAQTRRDELIREMNDSVAALTAERDGLQSAVDGLKAFERDYRASLRSHLEGQLAELAASEPAAATPEWTPPAEASWSAPAEDVPVFTGSQSTFAAPEVPEAFEVPPVEETAAESAEEPIRWAGFEAEETTTGGFGEPEQSTPVTYEIPGVEDADGEQTSTSGFGGN